MQESGLRIAIKSYQLSEDMLIIPLSKEACNSLGITLRDLLKSEFTILLSNGKIVLEADVQDQASSTDSPLVRGDVQP